MENLVLGGLHHHHLYHNSRSTEHPFNILLISGEHFSILPRHWNPSQYGDQVQQLLH